MDKFIYVDEDVGSQLYAARSWVQPNTTHLYLVSGVDKSHWIIILQFFKKFYGN